MLLYKTVILVECSVKGLFSYDLFCFYSFFLYVFLVAVALLLVMAGHYALTSVKVNWQGAFTVKLGKLWTPKMCLAWFFLCFDQSQGRSSTTETTAMMVTEQICFISNGPKINPLFCLNNNLDNFKLFLRYIELLV